VNCNLYKAQTYDFSSNFSLDIEGFPGWKLLPVGPWLLQRNDWVENMVRARALNMESFFSRFHPTVSSMKNYLLDGAISDSKKILFCVISPEESFLGHMGLKIIDSKHHAVDNVMRFEVRIPDLMQVSLKEVLRWSGFNSSVSKFSLEVISTNSKAIRFYEKVGFQITQHIPLRQVTSEDGVMSLVDDFGVDPLNGPFKLVMEKYL
jgi:RimJ/RimL family protein N-acetyltransferase